MLWGGVFRRAPCPPVGSDLACAAWCLKAFIRTKLRNILPIYNLALLIINVSNMAKDQDIFFNFGHFSTVLY